MIQGKKRVMIPIWLTTLIVITMILLFSLIIYDAREREMVGQFNRQQMAIAKGIAAGLEDLVSGIEKGIAYPVGTPGPRAAPHTERSETPL